MAVSLQDLKDVLYLDGNDENNLLTAYLNVSQQFVKNAVAYGDDDFFMRDDVIDLYDTAVKARAATLYQYRIELSDTQTYPIDLTLNSIIGQLRGMYLIYKDGEDDATSDQSAQQGN